jgi:dinuclear metal center YbgI/SA1388 family protein
MPTIEQVGAFLEQFAPTRLAESWDNVGLLVGDSRATVKKIMTCLTVTPASAAEAIVEQVDLIVTHHPIPFQPLKRITNEAPTGRMLWDLIRAGICIYSPHTAFDSAAEGINRHLAEGLGLTDVAVLVPSSGCGSNPAEGAGRFGSIAPAISFGDLAERVKQFLRIEQLQAIGDLQRPIDRVAVACGSAGEFLEAARAAGCQCLVTGETRFHTCLEAEATGMSLVLAGHFATERFGVERLAQVLKREFADVDIWASRHESDPLRWL